MTNNSTAGANKIHWLLQCRGIRSPSTIRNECPAYDTKQSDGEALVNLGLWGMQSTPLLPSLPYPLWPGVVAHDKVLSMGQIELNYNHVKMNCLKFLFIHLIVCKQKFVFMLIWIIEIKLFWHLTMRKLYLYLTELFETFIKMT